MAIKEMEYAPSGSIFTNDRKRGVNDPDYNGYLKITSEVLDHLIEKRMFDLELDMVAWGKKTKRDTNWLRLIASIPKGTKNKNPF